MRTLALIKNDIRLQFRHGFYFAYAFVSIVYIVLLRLLPPDARAYILPILIFSDPAVLGAFFIGGIVLLEKGESTLQSLFITPIRLHNYIISKVISLTILSILTSLIISIAGYGLNFNPFLLILGGTLTSVLFVLLGLVIVSRFKTLNDYLMGSVPFTAIFFVPVIDYFGLFTTRLFYILPTHGAIKLIGGAFGKELPPLDFGLSVLTLLVWIIVAYFWASRWIRKYVIESGK